MAWVVEGLSILLSAYPQLLWINALAICGEYRRNMDDFDVTIQIGRNRLAEAGIGLDVSTPSIAYAVRSVVEQLAGACSVVVEVLASDRLSCITVWPHLRCLRSDIPYRQDLRRTVEDAVEIALVSLRADISRLKVALSSGLSEAVRRSAPSDLSTTVHRSTRHACADSLVLMD
jgi:hypothetical protein